MSSGLIDVWDAKTFGRELNTMLSKEGDLVRNYMTTDHQIFLDFELDHSSERPMFPPDNPYAPRFHALQENIIEVMTSRTIRAWHYTRLTTEEVDILRKDGVHVSTPKTLRSRLDSLVASGALSPKSVDMLYAGSPFQSDQLEGRSGKFWMASHPIEIQDSGVERLMKYWGGEVASFWTRDTTLLAVLAALGKPSVIELAVPLVLTPNSYSAGRAVIATFGRTLGCMPTSHAFDLCVTAPLGPDSVLKVHNEGDLSFHSIALGYPEGYVDVEKCE